MANLCRVIFRREEIAVYGRDIWTWASVYVAIYVVSMTVFYSLLPILLSRASATVFNVSLMTVNIFSLISGYFILNEQFSPIFLATFFLITSGLVVYNLPQRKKSDSEV